MLSNMTSSFFTADQVKAKTKLQYLYIMYLRASKSMDKNICCWLKTYIRHGEMMQGQSSTKYRLHASVYHNIS